MSDIHVEYFDVFSTAWTTATDRYNAKEFHIASLAMVLSDMEKCVILTQDHSPDC